MMKKVIGFFIPKEEGIYKQSACIQNNTGALF